MEYDHIVSATDWFVVSHDDGKPLVPQTVRRIVAWGFYADGVGIALIPGVDNADKATLVPSEYPGTKFKHWTSLTEHERKLANQ